MIKTSYFPLLSSHNEPPIEVLPLNQLRNNAARWVAMQRCLSANDVRRTNRNVRKTLRDSKKNTIAYISWPPRPLLAETGQRDIRKSGDEQTNDLNNLLGSSCFFIMFTEFRPVNIRGLIVRAFRTSTDSFRPRHAELAARERNRSDYAQVIMMHILRKTAGWKSLFAWL